MCFSILQNNGKNYEEIDTYTGIYF